MIEPIARIRVTLRGTTPEIWRRLDVPLSTSLLSLHHIIQIAMGWKDTHGFRFEHGGRRYGVPDPNSATIEPQVIHAKTVQLSTLLKRGHERFLYIYDFGDNWRHDILVEDCRDGEADINYPALVDGAGRCPPEDVGGTSGFEVFLEAMTEQDHPEHGRLKAWYGKPFNPNDINERKVRLVLEGIAARRRGSA
jgi:hypothetical protein